MKNKPKLCKKQFFTKVRALLILSIKENSWTDVEIRLVGISIPESKTSPILEKMNKVLRNFLFCIKIVKWVFVKYFTNFKIRGKAKTRQQVAVITIFLNFEKWDNNTKPNTPIKIATKQKYKTFIGFFIL